MSAPPQHVLAALRLGEPAVIAPAPPGAGSWSVTVAGTLLGYVRADKYTVGCWHGYPELPHVMPDDIYGVPIPDLLRDWESPVRAARVVVAATTGVLGARVVERP